ncbi:YjdF family protein [Fervidicella metallireducens]|nr:YjdF family protein [Fervidicella metallireducens]
MKNGVFFLLPCQSRHNKTSPSKVYFAISIPLKRRCYSFIYNTTYMSLLPHNKLKFSRGIEVKMDSEKHINPKRLQRMIKKETSASGIGTKAQQAIKLQHENQKLENKKKSKETRQKLEQLKFQIRQNKKKEKKKGH